MRGRANLSDSVDAADELNRNQSSTPHPTSLRSATFSRKGRRTYDRAQP